MKKNLWFMLAASTMLAASCSNNDLASDSAKGYTTDDDVVLTLNANGATRNVMNTDLVNSWSDDDVIGVFSTYGEGTQNGDKNATFNFHSNYTANGITYKNAFVQDASETGRVRWTDESTDHEFYLYAPRTASATEATAIPFTLTNEQTQTTPNVWVNSGTELNNFMWKALKGTRPYNRSVDFSLNRLFPVVDFNIIRDDNTLDGYYLQSITLTAAEEGKLKKGAINVDLTSIKTTNSISFDSPTDVTNYKVTTTTDASDPTKGIDIASALKMSEGFHVYMSINPCSLGSHTITAEFKNAAGNVKNITFTRAKETFAINNGCGNLVSYDLFTRYASSRYTGETPQIVRIGVTNLDALYSPSKITSPYGYFLRCSEEFTQYCKVPFVLESFDATAINAASEETLDQYQIIIIDYNGNYYINQAAYNRLIAWVQRDESHILWLSEVTAEATPLNYLGSWLGVSKTGTEMGASGTYYGTLNNAGVGGDYNQDATAVLEANGVLGPNNPVLKANPTWTLDLAHMQNINNSNGAYDKFLQTSEGSTFTPIFYGRQGTGNGKITFGVDFTKRVIINNCGESNGIFGSYYDYYSNTCGLPQRSDADANGGWYAASGTRAYYLYQPFYANPAEAEDHTGDGFTYANDCTKDRIAGFRTGRIYIMGLFSWMLNTAQKAIK